LPSRIAPETPSDGYEPLENRANKQAAWRTDPARAGLSGCVGDIGTHAQNLLEFVTDCQIEALCADLSSFVTGRRLDDDANILLRLRGGARGTLVCSQVACGEENRLSIRVYGSQAGLEWHQENPNELGFAPLGQPKQVIRRASAGTGPAAAHATRIPSGHPEGYLEAFAQLYNDLAEQIISRREKRTPDPLSLLVPTVEDGVEGVRFIKTAIESSRNGSAWTTISR